MPRYIDADKLKDDIRRFWHPSAQRFELLASIDHIPTENVREATHGHWFISWDGEIICSVCGKHNPVHLMQNFPFCPYCGAEMDEEEEHEKVSFDYEEDDAEVVHYLEMLMKGDYRQ